MADILKEIFSGGEELPDILVDSDDDQGEFDKLPDVITSLTSLDITLAQESTSKTGRRRSTDIIQEEDK